MFWNIRKPLKYECLLSIKLSRTSQNLNVRAETLKILKCFASQGRLLLHVHFNNNNTLAFFNVSGTSRVNIRWGAVLQETLLRHFHIHNLRCILYNQRDATYTLFFIIISAVHVSGGFSAHHQELIKLYVQPWVLTCFPIVYRCCGWGWNCSSSTPTTVAVDSTIEWQCPRLHIEFYKLLMMGGKTARNMYSADNNKEQCISCISWLYKIHF